MVNLNPMPEHLRAYSPLSSVDSPCSRPACKAIEAKDLPPVLALCTSCHLSERCLPSEFAGSEVHSTDEGAFSRHKIRVGETLYREGDLFEHLYEVRSGNLKSSLSLSKGHERVSGFHMAGDLIGLDGLGTGHHLSTAVALEDTEVCAISYAFASELAKRMPRFQHALMQNLSREAMQEYHLLVRLGSLPSTKRLAAFLLNQSLRLSARGYSPREFHLRMTRADIASYLALTLETVCRSFSELQKSGLLEVEQRHVRILNLAALRRACA
jgi:CRP/FNR family transcriptional regulator